MVATFVLLYHVVHANEGNDSMSKLVEIFNFLHERGRISEGVQ
jgi:hypothetical protein